MRRFLPLALACALLLAACGPGGAESASSSQSAGASIAQPASSETLEGEKLAELDPFSLAAYPAHSFHPVWTQSAGNLALAPLLYEGLFTLDERFQAQPQLCQSYFVSADSLTWTFTLQPGVTFSDGTPVTGEIVAQALNAARGPESRYAARLAGVASIQGEENQVTVVLSQPNGALPQLLDVPIALGTDPRPPGTGPYVLTEADGELSLTARPDWRLGAENLPAQTIPLSTMTRSDEQLSAFNAGEIALLDVDLTGDSALGLSERYQVWDYNTSALLFLGFNVQQGLCQDPEVRRAVAQAVDRDYVADTIFARHAVSAALPIHPDSPWYDSDLAEDLEYDPAVLEALELEGRPITLVVNIGHIATSAAANHISQQLETAGLVVTVERLPWTEYLEAVAAGRFDLYLGEVYLTPDFDLTQLLGLGGSLNYGGWSNTVTESLLATFRSSQGEARSGAAAALCRHLVQQVPIAPICFQNGTVLTQYGRVEGLSPVYGNLFAGLENWVIS